MMYVRGNKKDFDDWAEAGNQGWSYEDVLPYFKKSEDNQNNIYATDNAYHSNEGELTISDIRWTTPLADLFLKAGEELGYATGDCNADNQTVFASPQLSTRNGTRCSTNKAFLVLINPETNHAFGVRYFKNGDYHEVQARKEVILSAGAANTPQLLMLSGVGPKDHIQELNTTQRLIYMIINDIHTRQIYNEYTFMQGPNIFFFFPFSFFLF
ncbi:Oxygen-dependent choline dehydrogenase [Armadillidium vulgare]|nr:Oxygen-dependent choline dehydrogenase [Armadillidium vulgare]